MSITVIVGLNYNNYEFTNINKLLTIINKLLTIINKLLTIIIKLLAIIYKLLTIINQSSDNARRPINYRLQ